MKFQINDMSKYLLLMVTNRALNITRLSCFGIIIWTPRVVMTTMTGKELSTAWELNTAEPLIMFTEPLSTLSTSWCLRRCFPSTALRVTDFLSVIPTFRLSCFTCLPFSSFTCLLFFPGPLSFFPSLFFLHCLFLYLSFFQGFFDKGTSFGHL